RQAAINHDYWNYWLPIPFAVGIAALAARLLERPRSASTPRVVTVGIVAVVAAFALFSAFPWNTPARAAYDRGSRAIAPLDAAASKLPPGSRLVLAGHFTSGAPWVTYELRSRPKILTTYAQAERVAAENADAVVLVKCDRRP